MEGEPLIKIEGWCLVSADSVSNRDKDLIDGGHELVSFMWHECEALKFEYVDEAASKSECEIKYLDAEDSQMGKCWYCMEQAPHDLHTVWTIHNMNLISTMSDPIEESWNPKYIKARVVEIAESKKRAKAAGYYDG